MSDCISSLLFLSLCSVLALTSAIVGSREELMNKIYPEALASGYLWYSYGDGMIVL